MRSAFAAKRSAGRRGAGRRGGRARDDPDDSADRRPRRQRRLRPRDAARRPALARPGLRGPLLPLDAASLRARSASGGRLRIPHVQAAPRARRRRGIASFESLALRRPVSRRRPCASSSCSPSGLLVASGRDLRAPAQAAAAVLLVFFFTDPGYLAAFQSLYAQGASLTFLLLTAGVAALADPAGPALGGDASGVFPLRRALRHLEASGERPGAPPRSLRRAPGLAGLGPHLPGLRSPSRSGPRRPRVALLRERPGVVGLAHALQPALLRDSPELARPRARPRGAGARSRAGTVRAGDRLGAGVCRPIDPK